ncbi:hypothetical protein WN943_027300 [Citrus x changshan-huyou]
MMFLLELQKLGKGDWSGIARNYVVSRTPTQVASHAQKYFIRQSNVSRRKRRSSLFNIVADEPLDTPAASQDLFSANHTQGETQRNNPLPAPPALDEECESMDSTNSNDGEPAPPKPENSQSCIPMMYHAAYVSQFFPFTYPYWSAYNTEPTQKETHEVLKPTSVHSKSPINVDELVGMSKLSLGESIGQNGPSSLSLKLDEGSSKQNEFDGSIPSSIGDMNSLKFLDLSHNQLTGEIPEHLAMGCFNLQYLVLSKNSLHAWLGNLSSLDDIMMARNHLRGLIPLEFCQLNYLKILDLSENNISGILPSCSGHSFIQQVHLSKHMLHGPLEYGTFLNRSHILTLDLSYNSFSGYIPYWIGRLTYLRYLIWANNNLEGEVPIQLSWSKELQLIDLSNNNLFGEIPSCLDNTSLHNNGYNDGSSASAFNRDVRGTYSAGSSTMEKEESLMFTTKETSYLYKGKPLNKMYGIDLSCNKLACEIPPQIGKLTRIRALNLSHNNLTGIIQ